MKKPIVAIFTILFTGTQVVWLAHAETESTWAYPHVVIRKVERSDKPEKSQSSASDTISEKPIQKQNSEKDIVGRSAHRIWRSRKCSGNSESDGASAPYYLSEGPPHTIVCSQKIDTDEHSQPPAIPAGKSSNFWPPWPFNLLSRGSTTDSIMSGDKDSLEGGDSAGKEMVIYRPPSSQSAVSMIWKFTKSNAHVGFKNMQEGASNLWFHLPPAAPPLVILAALPRRQVSVVDAVTMETITKTVIPLFSNAFVRNLVLSGTALAVLSWSHAELRRNKFRSSMPLAKRYRDINKAVLPPFLPEWVPPAPLPTIIDLDEEEEYSDDEEDNNVDDKISAEDLQDDNLQNDEKKSWIPFRDAGKSSKSKRKGRKFSRIRRALSVQKWNQVRDIRRRERKSAYRQAIYNELVARQQQLKATTKDNSDLGYALVTGASKGIGRACAVQLARWEIPLILVARDEEALMNLAKDIEACYGVECLVLPADLSVPGAAERVYKTTTSAGLKVDFLVNNAGISAHGLSVDMPLDRINRMIQLNTVSVATLTQLYGRDMKERRRGRIMMVSSVTGAVSGVASVAVYGATKAFENSLSYSLAKELEPYGIGVTCLQPGAVRGTDFQSASDAYDALCWKIPFYTKTARQVAKMGVSAMLRGDSEVTPGILNRIFLKVVRPVMPQRIHCLIAEAFWNPFPKPFQSRNVKTIESFSAPDPESPRQSQLPPDKESNSSSLSDLVSLKDEDNFFTIGNSEQQEQQKEPISETGEPESSYDQMQPHLRTDDRKVVAPPPTLQTRICDIPEISSGRRYIESEPLR